MVYGLVTFQGIRYSLFSCNTQPGADAGYADFDSIEVNEPQPRGLKKPVPYGRQIELSAHGRAPQLRVGISADSLVANQKASTSFTVIDRGLGRVALQSGSRHVSVTRAGALSLRRGRVAEAETFHWLETFTGELTLMSLASNRYLRVDFATGVLLADSPGPRPDGKDGVRFDWTEVPARPRPAATVKRAK